jgi:glycogen debranching enzyme
MVKEHFYNPEEFWGDYILPSIARNDPAYTGRDYWRGSIWAPMNFLVYMGFRNYELPGARKVLALKSRELLLKEWQDKGFVRENYHAETGTDPGARSNPFYHWGALLGMIDLMENGGY